MICIVLGILFFILNIWATTIAYYYCPVYLDAPVIITGFIFGFLSIIIFAAGMSSLRD